LIKTKKVLLARIEEANSRTESFNAQKLNSEKAADKLEHKVKLALAKVDESNRELNELNSQKSTLNSRVIVLVREKEEAEDLATRNLTQFRKAQNELKEANDRADEAERIANRLRSERRSDN